MFKSSLKVLKDKRDFWGKVWLVRNKVSVVIISKKSLLYIYTFKLAGRSLMVVKIQTDMENEIHWLITLFSTSKDLQIFPHLLNIKKKKPNLNSKTIFFSISKKKDWPQTNKTFFKIHCNPTKNEVQTNLLCFASNCLAIA